LVAEQSFLFFYLQALFTKDVDFLNSWVRPFFPRDEIHHWMYFDFEMEVHKASLLLGVVDMNTDVDWFDKEENHY
jgi:hypothetical protein